ncbi:MAG TPA: threonine synthase [Acidobacteriota bacterium]|nr:threonine synthase [Acidobacteriota bacterium]
MKFYSTAGKSPPATFRQAVERGLAPDGGLYMPQRIPRLADDVLKRLPQKSFAEIAYLVARPFVEGEIADPDLRRITAETVDFGAPLVHLGNLVGTEHTLTPPRTHQPAADPQSVMGDAEGPGRASQPSENAPFASIYAMELFHGPSLAFKDFGARFMARVLSHWTGQNDQPLTILVATSGDTGSAVAMGFLDVPGIEVVILYPSGQVSRLQEQQLTTLGHNITALEVEGSFDDCQRLVKEAFQDPDLRAHRRLSSANSINLARLIPQMFYYFLAYSRLPEVRRWRENRASRPRIVFSVPSGNFGNLTAGLMAKRMGLPIDHFIAATNINDVVPEYLEEGEFRPRPSRRTLSNAMDVGDPSNFARMMELYGHDWDAIRRHLSGRRYNDRRTLEAIDQVRQRTGYLLDPHGAVGYLALRDFLSDEATFPRAGVFLETAHPAKFLETCQEATGIEVEIPDRLSRHLDLPKRAVKLAADYPALRAYLAD